MDVESHKLVLEITLGDGSVVDFFKLSKTMGFEEAGIYCWENCSNKEHLRRSLKKQIDKQYAPTLLLEFMGYGLILADAKWLYKYLLHPYYLTQESSWGAAYLTLVRGVNVLSQYSERQLNKLKELSSEYYGWHIEALAKAQADQ